MQIVMRRNILVIAIMLLGGASTACSSLFLGSAPAADGGYYTVGQKAGAGATKGAIWHCPKPTTKVQDCKRMEVIEK
jgi:hypothetical protein